MKILKILLLAVLVIGIVVAVLAPIGPVPGFFIGGNKTPAPEQWMDTSKVDEIKLKVPGTLPRVVIIWVVEHADDLYVVGAADSGWVTMIGQGSPVEMQLGDNLYSLQATPVKDGLADVLGAYVAKYQPNYPDIVAGFPSLEEGKSQFGVFRLERG